MKSAIVFILFILIGGTYGKRKLNMKMKAFICDADVRPLDIYCFSTD